jgi:hypothetical protein
VSLLSLMKNDIVFHRGHRRFSVNPWLMFQGVSLFSVFLILCISIGAIFSANPGLNSKLLVSDSKVVQMPTVAGDVVRWSVIVKRSDIQGKQRFIKLPKNAKNITVRTVGQVQANRVLAMGEVKPQSPLYKLALLNKNVLAKGNTQTNLFDISAEPTSQPSDSNVDVVSSSQNQFVDLSAQTPESTPAPADQVQSSEALPPAEQAPDQQSPDQVSPETLSDQPSQVSESTPAPSEAIPAPTGGDSSQAPSSPGDEPPAPAVGNPETETQTPVEETPQVEIPSAESPAPETPEPTRILNTDNENFVEIDYTTPAPQMTEMETDSGKQVTVSVPDEPAQPDQPVTNVLAFTSIPEIYKVGQESKIKIQWANQGGLVVESHAYDLNKNGKLDYVEWTVPHLSEQTFNVIFISKAFQLDEHQQIYADIYDQVRTQDGQYASVPANQYIRVTFEKALTHENDITLYAKSTTAASVDIYPVYNDGNGNLTEGPMLVPVSDGQNPMFDNIVQDQKYRILLSNLATPTDIFDLRVNSNPIDVDYVVDPSSGPNFPSTGEDDITDGGDTGWFGGSNITSSDDSRANSNINSLNVTTHYLKATGFGFSIPAGAVINGIKVEWEKMDNTLSGTPATKDNASRIVKGGSIGSTDRSDSNIWSRTESFVSYGSSSDLWGETWTADDINSSTFGAALSVTYDSGLDTGGAAAVDSVRITVTYTTGNSISGNVYTDEGSTNMGSGKTVSVSVNGAAAAGSADTDGSGAYSIPGITMAPGDVLALYIDGETEKAVTVTRATGSNMTGIDLYKDDLVTRCDNSCSLTTTDITTARSNGDSDVSDIIAASSFVSMDLAAGKSLYIPSAQTFDPGTNVSVGGNFTNNGTFVHGSSYLTLAGTSNYTLKTNGSQLYNFSVNGSGGTYTLQDALTVVSNLSIDAGTLDTNSGFNYSIFVGGNWTNSGTFQAHAGIVTLNGGGSKTITSGGSSFYNLDLNGGASSWTLQGDTTVSGVLSITQGTLNGGSGTLTLSGTGGSPFSGGSFDGGTSTVVFTGNNVSGNTTLPSVNYYNNLILNNGSETYEMNGNIDVVNLTITAGTLDVGSLGTPWGITLRGNFSNSGTFVPRNGTVTLSIGNNNQTISGNTTFYNFDKNINSQDGFGRTLTFESGSTTTINGLLTLSGFNGSNTLKIRASTTSPATLHFGSGATFSGDYLDVSYNTAVVDSLGLTLPLAPAHSTDSGNTVGWFGNSISGTVYSDEGVTNIGAGLGVAVSINGATAAGTTTTGSNGSYSLAGLSISAGDVLTLYLYTGGTGQRAVTVTTAPGSDLTGIDLYQNDLVARSDNGGTLTTSNLETADDNGAAGISAIYSVEPVLHTLTVAAGKSFYIPAGQTFTPAGGGLIVGGNFTNNGTYTHFDEQLILAGTGSQTLKTNSSYLWNLTLNAIGGTYTLQDPLLVAKDLTLSAGTLDAKSGGNYAITVAGDWINTGGTFTARSGTVTLTSGVASATLTSGGSHFYNLVIDDEGGTGIYSLQDALSVDNNFSVIDGQADASATNCSGAPCNVTVGGNWSVGGGGAGFSLRTNTVTLTSASPSATISVGDEPFYNLTINASGGTYTIQNGVIVSHNLTITAGTLYAGPDLANYSIAVGGNWTNSGTFTSGINTVTLTGTGSQTLTTGSGSPFYNLTINGTGGTYALQDSLVVSHNLTLTAGTLDTNSSGDNSVTVGGTWSRTAGTFLPRQGVLSMTGTSTFSDTMSFYDFAVGANNVSSTTLTLGGNLTVTHHMTLNGGTLDVSTTGCSSASCSIAVGGQWVSASSANFTARTGTVTLTGTSSYSLTAPNSTFYNLTINGSGGTYTLGSSIEVGNNLTISAGTLDASASNYGISLSGNWSNSGTFTARAGSVTLSGVNQTISGSNTFYILTKQEFTNNSTNKTLTFTSGTTQTITHELLMGGLDSNDKLLIRASATSPATIDFTGSSVFTDSGGYFDISYNTVLDHSSGVSLPLNPASSTDSGNNVGWFPGFTAPSITSGPSDGGSSSGAPTNAGGNVTFTATATDTEADNYYLAICKTNAVTAVNNSAPTCDGGSWAISSSTASGAQASVTYTTSAGNSASNAWYAFVCDNSIASSCSSSSQGSGNNGSPFNTNHAPTFSAISNDASGYVKAGTMVTISATVSDPDAGTTFTLYACKSNDFTGSACGAAGEWGNSSTAAVG